MSMLEINDLHAGVEGNEILKGLSLTVQPGEVHAIMGPNGSGKSTLSNVITGRDGYEVTKGSITLMSKVLLDLQPGIGAREWLVLRCHYSVGSPGVSNMYFLKAALNATREHRGLEPLDAMDFIKLAKEKREIVELDEKLANRCVNEGFSGGEKKRNEIFQMAMLEPKLAILDETDSGLDIDALRVVANGINSLRSPERSIILITHYQRLLDYVEPDHIHVLSDGRIVRSGGKELALELEEKGYSWIDTGDGASSAQASV